MAKKNQSLKYPPLRFPSFTDEWKEYLNEEIFDVVSEKNTSLQYSNVVSASMIYGVVLRDEIGIDIKYEQENIKGYKVVRDGDYIIHLRSFQGGFAFSRLTGICSPAYTILRPKSNMLEYGFLEHYFCSSRFISSLKRVTYGIRDGRSISVGEWMQEKTCLPSLPEQRKIAALLSVIDERIETQSAVIKDQEALKGVLSKRLLTPEEDWMELAIRDCLTYEQPTKYIVRSTAYSSDSTLTPVLTANKGFILGYTNEQETYQKGACIIFDDFTLDCKYVPFAFKVKSSAIKILQAKEGFDIRFMFEVIKSLSLSPLAHKRHYISEVEPIKVLVPSFAKQEKIVRLFTALDERLAIEKEYAALLQKQKAYLLQQMFV